MVSTVSVSAIFALWLDVRFMIVVPWHVAHERESRVTVGVIVEYPRYQVGISTAEVPNKRMMILSLDAVRTFDSGIRSPAVRFEHSIDPLFPSRSPVMTRHGRMSQN